MEHKYCYYEGNAIHYQDEGKGNTLVLLHGFMNSLDVWSSFIYSFMRDMRVIAIDLPGHGKSDSIEEIHTMPLMADIVKVVLDKEGIESCVMLGHSMGGYATLAFARQYPYMLKGFGLLHSHAMVDDEETLQNRERSCNIIMQNRANYVVSFIPNLFYPDSRSFLQKEMESLKEAALEMKSEAIIAAQKGMAARQSSVDILEKTETPVLFVFGKNDSRIPLELAVSQAMLPKHSEILLLDKVAHMSHFETREIVKTRVRQFVESCYTLQREPVFIINYSKFQDLD